MTFTPVNPSIQDPTEETCTFCGRPCKGSLGRSMHEPYCKENPQRKQKRPKGSKPLKRVRKPKATNGPTSDPEYNAAIETAAVRRKKAKAKADLVLMIQLAYPDGIATADTESIALFLNWAAQTSAMLQNRKRMT